MNAQYSAMIFGHSFFIKFIYSNKLYVSLQNKKTKELR